MKRSTKLAVLSLAATLVLPAAAQDSANRDKEMLRRTQQALRDAQLQQEQAQRERTLLANEKTTLQDSLKRESEQREGMSGQLAATRRSLAALQREAQAERQASDARRVAAEKQAQELGARVQTLEQQLIAARQEAQTKAQAVERLVLVLDASTKALTAAEAKNRELYAAGMKAVQAYRDKGMGEVTAAKEPLFGLAAVRQEGIAEALRAQIDAERLQTTPAAPPATR